MDIIKAIETRTSVRNFSDEPVPDKDLKEIIRLAGLAPSVDNYQPWQYIAIRNKNILNKIAGLIVGNIAKVPESNTRLAKQIKNQIVWFSTFFREAPVLIALAQEPYENILEKGIKISKDEINKLRNYPDLQSAGASIQNLLLSAHAMGYGACWMSGPLFAGEEVEKLLNIKPPLFLVTFVALGKPQKSGNPKGKRNLGEELIIID
jgi:nitroreductase